MRKVLIYATAKQGSQEGNQLNEAIKYANNGDDVLYLTCGVCMGGCLLENPYFDRSVCKNCKRLMFNRAKHFLPDNVKIESVDNYYSKKIEEASYNVNISMNSIEEIKKTRFHGVNIGYGAMSTYISLTRNIDPTLTSNLKLYLCDLLRQQIVLTLILEDLVQNNKPDLIIFHNGRFAQYRPLLDLARSLNIPFVCTEQLINADGSVMKNYIFNDIPHSTKALNALYQEFWTKGDPDERERLGRQFFENRRYGKYSGDKIYVAEQEYGKLPADLDKSKENIVIFNSSEDEFCAIDKVVDEAALFDSQLMGLKAILDKYVDDQSKHFYLRIHPNLKSIKYNYHTDLYKLDYANLTIVPADSSISSYALLDVADKVLVFGSTMGVEAAYWGKPTINLAYALYSLMDVVYVPKTIEELWLLIDDPKLEPKPSHNALPYGYYYMSDEHDKYEYIENGINKYKIFGHEMRIPRYCTMLGSDYLYLIISETYKRTRRLFKLGKYNKIPK